MTSVDLYFIFYRMFIVDTRISESLFLQEPLQYKYLEKKNSLSILGDSLEVLKQLKDNSISLILTDPPYHSTKKANIFNDRSFDDDTFIEWMTQYAKEWRRVLKNNGSLYVFCSPVMMAQLSIMLKADFNILSTITWTKPNEPGFDGWKQKTKKEALRQWYDHSERIIFAEPSFEGNLFKTYFGNYLRMLRKSIHLSGHALTELVGEYGKVNHGGAVSNWEAGRNVPSRQQYEKIIKVIKLSGYLEKIEPYEDVIRPFNVNADVEYTDVWTFENVRPFKGKHPAEKPISMLEHIIQASTNPGDIVLDCFSGSGATAIAALQNDRKSINIEIDERWYTESINRIEYFLRFGQRIDKNVEFKNINFENDLFSN